MMKKSAILLLLLFAALAAGAQPFYRCLLYTSDAADEL